MTSLYFDNEKRGKKEEGEEKISTEPNHRPAVYAHHNIKKIMTGHFHAAMEDSV